VQSQLLFQGLDPARDLIEIGSPDGRISAELLEAALVEARGSVQLVLLPGVQYLSGEAVDLAACAEVARRHDCRIGFDLAHAIGNVPVDVRSAEPDFAVWCSYKYLNGGPGAIGGCFVNRRWTDDNGLQRFEGWWGHNKDTRFALAPMFSPMASAEAWQLSNPPVLAMVPLEASLDLFAAAGIQALQRKSVALTAYLEWLLDQACGDRIELLTPRDPAARGAQLSIRLRTDPAATPQTMAALDAAGVCIDWRKPDVLRLAPVPLYNSFADVHASVRALAAALGS
jgi:kynureninase